MTTPVNWDQAYESGKDYSLMDEDVLDKALAEAPEGRASDLGCGTGDLVLKLARRGYGVLGLDLSEVALGKARQSTTSKAIEFSRADFEGDWAQSLRGQQFDVVTCKLVLAFISDKDKFLKQIKTVIAPGGVFILQTPAIEEGQTYSPRLMNISIQSVQLYELLKNNFAQIEEIDRSPVENAFRLTYVLK